MSVQPTVSSSALYIARDRGLFRDEGIELEFVRVPAATYSTLVVQGGVDAAAAPATVGFFNAVDRGAAARIVAEKDRIASGDCIGDGFFALRETIGAHPPTAPETIRGLRIAAGVGSYREYQTDLLLRRFGLTQTDIVNKTIPFDGRVGALLGRQVDVAPLLEPHVTRAIETGRAAVWMPSADITPGFPYSFIVFGERLAVEEPDLGRRFIRAYLRGVRAMKKGKTAENVAILERVLSLDEPTIRAMCWPFVSPDLEIDTRKLDAFVAWGVDKGYIDHPRAASEYWDPSFARWAVQHPR